MKVAQFCLTLCDPMWTIQSMEFSSQNTGLGSLSLLQGIFPTQGLNPTQGSNPGLLHCRRILYQLTESQGKPKHAGMGSLSLLQGIFLTQELNQGLLLCTWILYHLNYDICVFFPNFFSLAWHKHFCFNFWLLIYFFTRPLLYLALSVILYFLMLISIFNVNFF